MRYWQVVYFFFCIEYEKKEFYTTLLFYMPDQYDTKIEAEERGAMPCVSNKNYTVISCRPFDRRDRITARPPGVLILFKNPCTRARRRLFPLESIEKNINFK